MARPCGCAGECGCTIVGIDGIRTSGTGSTRDPLLVGLSTPLGTNGCEAVLDCVGGSLGNGLTYDDTLGRISTRISGDSSNNIVYGSDGGLYATGGSGGGSDASVTVDSLPATNLVGGYYGAGFSQFPEGILGSYEAAMDIDDIHFIHVPVRRISDYFISGMRQRALSYYNSTLPGTLTTATCDMKRLKRLNIQPSGPLNTLVNQYDPTAGYFGSGHPDTGIQGHGGILLSDIFRVTARRKVLFLDIKDLGGSIGDTLSPSVTYSVTLTLVQQWGLTKSIIAGGEIAATVSGADRTDIINGLKFFKDAGIATGLLIASAAEATANPPATVANLYGGGTGPAWIFLASAVAEATPATATAYRDAGFKVVLVGAHRQFQYELQRTLALRGMISSDPVYAAGWKSQFRYRKAIADWDDLAPDYGRHAYLTQNNVNTSERGYIENGDPGKLVIKSDLVAPGADPTFQRTAYLVLAGEQCPINDPARTSAPGDYGHPSNYDIEVGFSWSRLVGDTGRWMGVFFGVPEDRPMTEWVFTNAYTKGYQLQLSQNGTFTLQRYDGIPWTGPDNPTTPIPPQFALSWSSGLGTITPGTEYRILIQVRPNQINVGRWSSGNVVVNGHLFDNTEAGGRGDMWRGPYFYLGRHVWSTADSAICRFHTLTTRVFG